MISCNHLANPIIDYHMDLYFVFETVSLDVFSSKLFL